MIPSLHLGTPRDVVPVQIDSSISYSPPQGVRAYDVIVEVAPEDEDRDGEHGTEAES